MIGALARSKRPGSPRRSSSSKNAAVHWLWHAHSFSNRSPEKRVPALTSNAFDAGLGERRPLEVAVFGHGGLVMKKAPQPGHVDTICRQIIHEAQRQLVVVY